MCVTPRITQCTNAYPFYAPLHWFMITISGSQNLICLGYLLIITRHMECYLISHRHILDSKYAYRNVASCLYHIIFGGIKFNQMHSSIIYIPIHDISIWLEEFLPNPLQQLHNQHKQPLPIWLQSTPLVLPSQLDSYQGLHNN